MQIKSQNFFVFDEMKSVKKPLVIATKGSSLRWNLSQLKFNSCL